MLRTERCLMCEVGRSDLSDTFLEAVQTGHKKLPPFSGPEQSWIYLNEKGKGIPSETKPKSL